MNRGVRAMLFGHGPIFRDLNVAFDAKAVDIVPRSGVPVFLVPYTVARQVRVTGNDLDRIAQLSRAGRRVAERCRPWREFWRSDVGLNGSSLRPDGSRIRAQPGPISLRPRSGWVAQDAPFRWFDRRPTLLVTQADGEPTASSRTTEVTY